MAFQADPIAWQHALRQGVSQRHATCARITEQTTGVTMDLQFGLAVALVVVAGFLLANKAGAGPIIWADHGVASQRSMMLSGVSFVFDGTLPRISLPSR